MKTPQKTSHSVVKKKSEKKEYRHKSYHTYFFSFLPSFMKKQPAFTLIELMVVMAIVAILATAGISAYSGYTKKARDTSRVEIGRTIESSVLGLMASNNGRAPTPAALKSALTNEGIEIKDPAGGGDMCLDDDGATANQPCRFDYVAYDDGSYSISYGVESPDSTKANFYQTTFDTLGGGTLTKVGVYRGSAPFVGAAVNTTYQPTQPDQSTLIAIPSNLDAKITTEDRLDTTTSGGSGGGSALTCTPTCGTGATCTESGCKCGTLFTCTNNQICTNDTTCSCPGSFPTTCGGTCVNTNTDATYCGNCDTQCQSGDVCTAGVCVLGPCSPSSVGGYAVIRAADDKCWFTQNLPGHYQWGRSDTTFTTTDDYPYDWSSPRNDNLWTENGGINNPCPTGSHVPSKSQWEALIAAEGGRNNVISTLNLPYDGGLLSSNSLPYSRFSYGFYWSSSPININAYYLIFDTINLMVIDNYFRSFGFSVRCIVD